MSKTLVQSAKVRTNTEKGSVCKIQVQAVKFADLWDAYPSGNPCDGKTEDGKLKFTDQCAIRVGVALKKVGVTFKSFPKDGKCWFDGHQDHILRAEKLAEWLKLQPFVGCTKVATVTGADWQDKIKGRTGIVFFANYWRRSTSEGGIEKSPTGDHIDLWNGSRLTISGPLSFLSTMGRRLGRDEVFPGTDFGYSDLAKATTILFWEIK